MNSVLASTNYGAIGSTKHLGRNSRILLLEVEEGFQQHGFLGWWQQILSHRPSFFSIDVYLCVARFYIV